MQLLSQALKIGKSLDNKGVFDPILDRDSHFFINVQRLKQTDVPEFTGSYEKIHAFFREIIKLLDHAREQNERDTFYHQAVRKFHFPEIKSIRLGHSKSGKGCGFGKILERQVIYTAYDIVKAGIEDPEFFEMIPLFQDKVGPDRLSDMIAGLIIDDITTYTKRIYKEIGLCKETYNQFEFDNNGLMVYKGNPVLLVPVQIIHKLPVAEQWSEISTAMSENSVIRAEMNDLVASEWSRYNSAERKAILKRDIFLSADSFSRVLVKYRQEKLPLINTNTDFEYFLAKLYQDFSALPDVWKSRSKIIDSLSAALDFLERFKHWVEYNGGWEVIRDLPSKNKEKLIQRIIHGYALIYIECNNLACSCEPNEGYGPCDFKFSRGQDCTVVELKLSSNNQYMHGFEKQLPLYAESEKTDKMVYILMDVGNPGNVEAIQSVHDRMVDEGRVVPELIVIDAKAKLSASKA